MYYFTHPQWDERSQAEGPPNVASRRTAIHQGRLTVENGVLVLDRNVPAGMALLGAELTCLSWSCRFGNFSPAEVVSTPILARRDIMDWNRIEGNWKLMSGRVKEQWGQLTEDDITQINGKREQLEGKIQERYGRAKDDVRRDIDDWYARQTWS